MVALDGPTLEFLTETVLDSRSERSDRLFSLNLLLAENDRAELVIGLRRTTEVDRFLVRISEQSRDPFIRKLAALTVRRAQIAEQISNLDLPAR